MKRFLATLVFCAFCAGQTFAQPVFSSYGHTLDFFLPKYFPDMENGGKVQLEAKFNPGIPQPKDILGFELGEYFTEWHAVLRYMYTLERLSDRVSVRTVETTYEKRPIIEVMITSPENQKNIDLIRREHLKLSNVAESRSLDVSKMPVIISHINSMHGKEASGVNSSLAVAYFFAASEDKTVLDILDNAVILITPGINPDGINRYAAWANSAMSVGQRLSDLNSREYSSHEPWPGGRTNHYWHDTNRDLVMAQHPEGKASINIACDWMPNVIYDFHEYGGASKGYFFSPGHQKRIHPFIPMEGQGIAREFGRYSAAVFDGLNEKYFTEKSYDDYYLGKTGAYGDIQGIVSMLVEQENPQGYKRAEDPKKTYLDLPVAIRNQAHVAITSVFAALQNREKLHDFQRNFFLNSADLAREVAVKGYVFNTRGDSGLEFHVLDWMKNHRFDVYRLAKDIKIKGVTYRAGDSYIIPAEQKYYLKFRGLWEDITNYESDRFYDVTTWAAKRAFNVQECELAEVDGLIGDKVVDFRFPEGKVSGLGSHGYIVQADDLYSHNILRALLLKGIHVEIAMQPFKVEGVKYCAGTAYVSLENQTLQPSEIHDELLAAAKMNGVQVTAADRPVKMKKSRVLTHLPRVAIITGSGMSSVQCGQIWHMLDLRFGLTPARIDINRVHKVKDLGVYDVIIMPNGVSTLPSSDKTYPKLKSFVENGGTIIATGKSLGIVKRSKMDADIHLVKFPSKVPKEEKNYGCIIGTEVDETHPLFYGYRKGNIVPVFKKGMNLIDMEKSGYDSAPMVASPVPYLSGYTIKRNLDMMASNPIVVTKKIGEGTLIYSTDDLTFRSYWFGTMKFFMNAIYFGNF